MTNVPDGTCDCKYHTGDIGKLCTRGSGLRCIPTGWSCRETRIQIHLGAFVSNATFPMNLNISFCCMPCNVVHRKWFCTILRIVGSVYVVIFTVEVRCCVDSQPQPTSFCPARFKPKMCVCATTVTTVVVRNKYNVDTCHDQWPNPCIQYTQCICSVSVTMIRTCKRLVWPLQRDGIIIMNNHGAQSRNVTAMQHKWDLPRKYLAHTQTHQEMFLSS